MEHPLSALIEAKILEAQAKGELDNLPGEGAPLPDARDHDTALLGRVMKDNGALPPFVALSRELADLRAELAETGDRSLRAQILKDMSMMELRIEMARKDWVR
ncbi:MAG: DUF1992 domain-containing protein [Maritimibacter sp.]